MRRLLLPGLVIAFVLAIMLVPSVAMGVSIPPAPYTSADDCLACHQAGNNGPVVHAADFNAPAVDKTRCNACHYAIGPDTLGTPSHPPHLAGGNCADCHNAWPTVGLSVPWKQTFNAGSFGWFSTSSSLDATAGQLHAIHNKRSWPADVTSRSLGCPNCHAPAACSACHGDIPHDAHPTQNGNPAPVAPVANLSPTPSNVFAPDYFTPVSCAAQACHGGIGFERIVEDTDPAVSADPNWTRFSGPSYLGGSALRAAAAGSVLTVAFTGNEVSVWGQTGAVAGAINVWIDGVFKGQKDLNEIGSHFRDGVWMSGDLGPGPHTLRIVTAASPSYGTTTVWFDRIVARDLVEPTDTTPQCTTCHPDRVNEHGYDTVDHVADEAATPSLGKTCGDCHSMDLQIAHAAVSIPNGSDAPITGCAICHSVLPGKTLTAEGSINPDHLPQDPSRWNQTCEACHNASNPVVGADKHLNAAMHTLSGAAATNSAKCFTCHPAGNPAVVDLPTMHASATVTIGTKQLTGCDVCHKNPTLPRDVNGLLPNDCTVCHFTFDSHPKDHTSSYNLSSCDNAGCHTASVTVVGSNATTEDLVSIHNEKAAGGTFDCNGCHGSTDTKVKNAIASGNTDCDACHTLGADGGANDPHYVLHWANPPLADGLPATPHYAYVTGSAPGGTFTSDCLGCHTSNVIDEHLGVQASNGAWSRLPRHDAAGNSLTCATCHASSRLQVLQAILAGKTNCDACHVVHKQIPAQHATSFKANPEYRCTDCHSSDLTVLHNGGLVATTGNGTRLSGCALCHDYTTSLDSQADTMGARVQAAIATGDPDNYCQNCHLTYHTSVNHTPVTTASVGPNGCAGCHKDTNDVTAVHQAVTSPGPCAVCHNNAPRVARPLTSPECKTCHAITSLTGAGHSGLPTKHNSATITASCQGTGCHAVDLAATHDPYASKNGFSTSCDMCHKNPTRIRDITQKTAECNSCHDVGPTGHIGMHVATDAVTVGCEGCHTIPTGGDIASLHANATSGPCNTCHNNPTKGDLTMVNGVRKPNAACGQTGCHPTKTPYDPSHYPTMKHADGQAGQAYEGTTCSLCHSMDLGAEHVTKATSTMPDGSAITCVKCHTSAKFASLPDTTTAGSIAAVWNSTCEQCHTTKHSSETTLHASPTITSTCQGSACHIKDLPTAHNAYASKNGFSTSCAMCHANASRIPDITKKTADCSSCHAAVAPAGHVGVHVGTDTVTVGCEGCHTVPTGSDIASLHVSATAGPCNTCHNNPTKGDLTMSGGVRKPNAACGQAGCHPTKTPYDTSHYPAPKHAANQSLTVDPSIGTACGQCHYMDMKAEHITKTTSVMPDGSAITCVKCHASTKFASLPDTTTVGSIAAVWSPQTCEKCHTVKHDQMSAKHDFSTIRPTCAGTGCHTVTDVASIHTSATVTVGGKTLTRCAVCHQTPTTVPARDCLTCHVGATAGHKTEHEATTTVLPAAQGGGTFGASGCAGCHLSNLIDEHITSGLKGTAGSALTCNSCHGSANTSVKNAIAAGDVSCDACHPAVNNKNRHQNQWANEFTATNSSMHRVNSSLPGMRSSFVINGTTYTWGLPTSTWLKAPLTTSSVVSCRDCHTFSGTAQGPHGAAVTVNIDPSYPGDYTTASLGRSSSIICDKCHVNYTSMNKVHGEGDHSGEECTNCHSNLPHGWKLPRMLAYTTDPAPYKSNKLNAISLKNHSASGSWSESDCAANCEDHGGSLSTKWPSVAQTVATINGTVMDSANATGLAGAVVTLSNGQSTTTFKGGGYRLSNLAAGTYTVSVTATGFIGQSAGVTIVSSTDYFANFNLLRQGTIGGTVKDSSTNALLSGVTVTMNGRSIVTTGAGNFDFGSQTAGSYSLTYSLSGYTSQTKSFTVSDGAATDASVALVKIMYGTVTGKITDKATGAGIANATVGCSLDGTTTTASDGTYTLNNVLYGTGTLTVIAPSYDSTSVACVVNAPTTTNNVALAKSTTQNIAQGKTASSSQSSGSSNGASAAFDGNATTYWNSGSFSSGWGGSSSDSAWLQADLGASPAVYNKFVVNWNGSYYAKTVNVQTSTDGNNWTTVASTTSGTGGSAQTFTLANGTNARYVRLSVSGANTSSGYRVNEFQVWSGGTLPPVSVNVAKGKVFTTSSTYSSSYPASNAGDGSYSTYWMSHSLSYSNSNEWLQVDFGTSTSINRVVVGWNGTSNYAKSYNVQTSTDGNTWSTVYSTTSGNSSSDTIDFTARTARYVRVNCTDYNSSSGYRIYELEAWTP